MTRVANLVHRDEFPDVRREFEASHPIPPRPAAPSGRRVHADAVLAFLRGIDAADTTPAGLGMRRPAAPSPQPRPSQTQLAAAAQLALHTVVEAYEDTADDVEILLATLAELAPFADAVKAGASR